MTVPRDNLERLVRDVFGPSNDQIATAVTAIFLYKADPSTTERLFKLMEEDSFGFPTRADETAALLKRRIDELEAGVKV